MICSFVWNELVVKSCWARLGCDTPTLFSPFHLHPYLWPGLGGICQRRNFSLHTNCQVRSPLASPLPHPSRFYPAQLPPKRQQNVSALHLHVRAADNKLNAVLTGHWEVISATCCILVASGVYHPIILSSSFACNMVEFLPSQGRWLFTGETSPSDVWLSEIMALTCVMRQKELISSFWFWYIGIIFKD